MKFIWMYTGSDEKTHFADLDVTAPNVTERLEYMDIGGVLGAQVYQLNPAPEFGDYDFHNSPRRQLLLFLTGSSKQVSGTGEFRITEPGTMLLCDDLTGEGHRSERLSTPQQLLVLPIDPDLPLDEIFIGLGVVPHPV